MTKFEMDALIDAAIYHLDDLCPILGLDLRIITECFPYDLAAVTKLYGECCWRKWTHARGSVLWNAWHAALGCLMLIQRHGCKYNNHPPILEG